MYQNCEPDQHWMPSPPSILSAEGFALLTPEHLQEGVGDVFTNDDILEGLVHRIIDWHTFCCQLLDDGGLVRCQLPH